MKTKITLISLLSILLFAGAFFVNDKNVLAQFFEEESSKPIKSFEDYSRMNNLKERIVAVNKETPRNKSVLWRQNLIYHADRMNLNQEQKDWVKVAYDFLDEDFFTVAGGDESEFVKTDLGKSFEKLMIRKSEIFTREQAKKFCITLGNDSTLINSGRESNGSDSDNPYCNCTASWCGQCLEEEVCENPYCFNTDGCGCFAVWRCVKKCSLGLP